MNIFIWIILIILSTACWWAWGLLGVLTGEKVLANTRHAMKKSSGDYGTMWACGPFSFVAIGLFYAHDYQCKLIDKWFPEEE